MIKNTLHSRSGRAVRLKLGAIIALAAPNAFAESILSPTNDNFAQAIAFSTHAYTNSVSLAGATSELGERSHLR